MNDPRILTLIDKLRNDTKLRNSFNMAQWADPEEGETINACNTVGCIAGKAMLLFDESLSMRVSKSPLRLGDAQTIAANLLDLGYPQADHLFLPNCWVDYVVSPQYFAEPRWSGLSHNERPSLSTVAEMIAWCEGLPQFFDGSINDSAIYPLIKPDHAANALEGLLSHPGYVNWAEALA